MVTWYVGEALIVSVTSRLIFSVTQYCDAMIPHFVLPYSAAWVLTLAQVEEAKQPIYVAFQGIDSGSRWTTCSLRLALYPCCCTSVIAGTTLASQHPYCSAWACYTIVSFKIWHTVYYRNELISESLNFTIGESTYEILTLCLVFNIGEWSSPSTSCSHLCDMRWWNAIHCIVAHCPYFSELSHRSRISVVQ